MAQGSNVQRAGTCTTLEEQPQFAPLPNPESRNYLAEKAKFALKTPNKTVKLFKGKTTNVSLYQITMTGLIRVDEWRFDFRWFYKAEVSFDMTKNPPMPFLSTSLNKGKAGPPDPGRRHTLNPFPPGHTPGFLRRPDVIIVTDMATRWPGRAGVDQDGVPHGDNLQRVVEIKFPGDELGRDQRVAYETIAGGVDRFSVCDVNKCEDDDDDGDGSGGGNRVRPPVFVPPPIPRNDTGAGGAPVPVAPGARPKPKPGGLAPVPEPQPNGAQRIPAPVYGPTPVSDPAWYERLGHEAQEIADAIARAFSQLSAELRAKIAKLIPWLAEQGHWVMEKANEAWVWVNEKGEHIARWTKEQLVAAWKEICRQTDLVWEQLKEIDWGQVLIDIGKAVVIVIAVIAAGVVAYIVAVLLVELLAALIAIIGISAAGFAALLGAAFLAAEAAA
jgi:hypothetical protein